MTTFVPTQKPAAGQLREARRQLMTDGDLSSAGIRPELAQSWLRSWKAGLPPCGQMPGAPHASGAQLARALERERELVAHARPVMEFVFEQTRNTDSMVILAGADGMLLQAMGDAHFISRAERVALRPGATWHEQYRGTNAIGTALTENRALVVHAGEHYLERNGFLACTAAPIHDPSGRLLGALDVSCDHRAYHPHTLGLVRSAARMIEHRLFDTRHDLRHGPGVRLRLHTQAEGIGTVTEGLLALGEDGILMGANAAALSWLQLEWHHLRRTHINAVISESLDQLHDWTVRGSSTPRVIHTRHGHALWVCVEGHRPAPTGLQPLASRSSITEALMPTRMPTNDALAALDTGDAVITAAIARARKVMGKPIALLLQGESGVGKEVFARAVHDSGPRRQRPFVAVNCAALPEHLIEAELFGYVAGAFTGARKEGSAGRIREAEGGTLFLDEIGDMPMALQARLLRVLQERLVHPLGGGAPVPVDFALICATHRDLPQAMASGQFRDDLYYRINGLTLRLPALRQRTDLAVLLQHELQRQLPGRAIALHPELQQAMLTHPWPGNLRQLCSALRTACAMLDDDEQLISWHHLSDDLEQALRQPITTELPTPPSLSLPIKAHLRQAIAQAIEDCNGNLSEAARKLGIGRSTLYRQLRQQKAASDDASQAS